MTRIRSYTTNCGKLALFLSCPNDIVFIACPFSIRRICRWWRKLYQFFFWVSLFNMSPLLLCWRCLLQLFCLCFLCDRPSHSLLRWRGCSVYFLYVILPPQPACYHDVVACRHHTIVRMCTWRHRHHVWRFSRHVNGRLWWSGRFRSWNVRTLCQLPG